MIKTVSLIGSTGSIGTQALSVIKEQGYRVVALAAYQNISLLEQQVREYRPEIVCIYNKRFYSEFAERLKDCNVKVVSGMEGLCEAAAWKSADILLNAVVGMIGLQPTLEGIAAGKQIALANKETLVTGGALVMNAALSKGVSVLPVDSEHSALFQAMEGNSSSEVQKLILTASGGPFYGKSKEELAQITVEEALCHPNWSMGPKITVDSATLMNKGLELIEAVWLFGKRPSEIEVVVHRESVIHSAVEYVDGSVIAQMAVPDMRIPIQYALTYPERCHSTVKRLSLFEYPTLHFGKPDEGTFACLRACREAISKGGLAPTLVNGANEQAVALFLEKKISFLQIGEIVSRVGQLNLEETDVTLDAIMKTDQLARNAVMEYLEQDV